MLKRIVSVMVIAIIAISICSNAIAASTSNKLEVVQKSSEKVLENVQGNITKTIVDSNLDEGEIIIELKFKNNKEDIVIPPEIFFVIDMSRKYGNNNKYW